MTQNYYTFVREQFDKHQELSKTDKELALLNSIKPILKSIEAELEPYEGICKKLEIDLENQKYADCLTKLQQCVNHLANLSDIIRKVSSKLDCFRILVNRTEFYFLKDKFFQFQYQDLKEKEQIVNKYINKCYGFGSPNNLGNLIQEGKVLIDKLDPSLNAFYTAKELWKKEMIKYGFIIAGVLTIIILIVIYPWLILIPVLTIGGYIYYRYKKKHE